ncbi:MAG: hypothetical protein ACRCZS_27045 [Chroococcidiopsis sp.]
MAINPLVAVQAKDPDRADLVRQLTAAYPLQAIYKVNLKRDRQDNNRY